jgi:sugar lactone lactonase YvrE
MPGYKIDTVGKVSVLGEAPHWIESRQELIYVDILGQALHRYLPSSGDDFVLPLTERISFAIPLESESNKYVIGLERKIALLEWDGISSEYKSLEIISTVEEDTPKNRFNDGKCDPQGRLWAGTMGHETTTGNVDPKKGNLYSLDLEGKVRAHVDKIDISNGLAWSLDSTRFYYIDSCALTVDVFDFDAANGAVSNRRVLFDLPRNGILGLPDGMCVDADDNLWIAVHLGSKVLHVDTKRGALIGSIDFSGRASKITSVAFGGPNLETLYVTSANVDLTPEELLTQPEAGALFAITNLGVRGPSGGVNYKGKIASS